jgi:seryl-tRNA synthetase
MIKQKLSAKDYLSQAYRIDQRINSKIEQIQSLRALAEKATATLTNAPKSGNRNIHRMEDIIAKMVDMESEINADMNRLVDLKHEIVTFIKYVESVELQTLLELRYLSFKTWEQISVEMNFDRRHVTRLHGRALQEVEFIRRA